MIASQNSDERFFNRHEFKYIITEKTAAEVLSAIQPHMKRDRHTNEAASYRISSLYFDTAENLFHEEYLRAEQFRQKLRLRVYNQPTLLDPCFFEIKKKFEGFVSKRRAKLTLGAAYAWLENRMTLEELCHTFPKEAHVIREISFLRQHYQLEPRVVISYLRQAHVGIFDETLRVTMDRQLSQRTEIFQPHIQPRMQPDLTSSEGVGQSVEGIDRSEGVGRLVEGINQSVNRPSKESGKNPGKNPETPDCLYLPTGKVVLEVKSSGMIPLWLARTLSRLNCRKQAFSKYSTSYNPPEINDTGAKTDRRHA